MELITGISHVTDDRFPALTWWGASRTWKRDLARVHLHRERLNALTFDEVLDWHQMFISNCMNVRKSIYLFCFLIFSWILICGALRRSGLQPWFCRGRYLQRESCSEDLIAESGSLVRRYAIGRQEAVWDEYVSPLHMACSTLICSEEMPSMRLT